MEGPSCRFKTDRRGVEWPVIHIFTSEYVGHTLAFTITRKIERLEIASSNICSNNLDLQCDGTKELVRLITADPRLVDYVNHDVLSHCCTFLQYKESKAVHVDHERKSSEEDAKHRDIQYYSAIIFTNVVTSRKVGTSKRVFKFKDEVVSALVDLIPYPDEYMQVEVLEALSNFCHKFPDICGIIIDKRALEFLDTILTDLYNHYALLDAGAGLLVALSLCAPHLLYDKTEIVTSMLSTTIMSIHECVIIEACKALSCVSKKRFLSLETEVVGRLLELIQCSIYPVPNITFRSLEVIGNYVRWASDENIQFMIEKDLVLHLGNLLKHKHRRVRKEACWIISNIAATSQIHAVTEVELMDILISLVKEEDEHVKETAAVAISNIVFGDQNQIDYFRSRCIEPLKDLVNCSHDPMIVAVCSQVLSELLSSTGSAILLDDQSLRGITPAKSRKGKKKSKKGLEKTLLLN